MIQTSLSIAGQDVLGDTFDVKNPYSGNVVGQAAEARYEDVERAINAAHKAQPSWEKMPQSAKRAIFLKAADLVSTEKYASKIKEYMKAETEASPIWCQINVMASVNLLRQAASQASEVKGQYIKSERADMFLVTRRAAGVVYAVAPWNAPINLSLRAIAIPLICGNTVVLKASENSPASQRIVVDLLLEAGLPESVLHYVTFGRENAGEITSKIIAHPAIRRINFTGSDIVGRKIAAEAAKHLKQCIFELGGKAPVVVLNDADLETASSGIVQGALIHSGQVCMSTERVIAQSGIVDKLTELISKKASNIKSGRPGEEGIKLGPLFTPNGAVNVVEQLKEAKASGAKVHVGNVPEQAEGDFKTVVQPHVLSSITRDMKIWKQETFGPVISITSVETIDEAITAANDSEYSLIAALWTTNLHSATEVAPRIRAGHVVVNSASISIEPSFGNAGLGGLSGYGRFDIASFTDERSISFMPPGEKFPMVDGH